jgi:hypothetical protein
MNRIFSRFTLLPDRRSQPARSARTLQRCARLGKDSLPSGVAGLKVATKFVPLLSRKACHRLALLLGSLGTSLDRPGRRVALSNLRVAFGDEILSERQNVRSA